MTEGESTSEAGRTEAASEFVYTQITTIYYTCWGEIPRDCRETDRIVTYVLKEVTSLAGVGPDGMDYPGSGPSESTVNMCPHPFMTGQYIECPEDMCPFGFEKVDDVCLEECEQGFERDENGICVLREKPCKKDPLIQMAISPWNSDKNANRFGCVRVQTGSICGGEINKRNHAGLDLEADIDTPVYSVSNGTVFATGSNNVSLGNYIIIKSGDLHYLYAHLKSEPTVAGIVSIGSLLGYSGDSATPGEPHLHIEVKKQTGMEDYNDMTDLDIETYLDTKFGTNGETIKNFDCE